MVRRIRQLLAIGMAAVCARLAAADVALEPKPLIDRLDESTRAKVILALAGLVLLGVLMMGLTWLAFRMLRKQFRHTEDVIQRQKDSTLSDDWAHKPLADHSDLNQA